jgi:hypothetical protein
LGSRTVQTKSEFKVKATEIGRIELREGGKGNVHITGKEKNNRREKE